MFKEAQTAKSPAETTITKQLDDLFAPWNRSDAPGLVVGVAIDGVPLYRRGFGMASLETSTANTPKTKMRIGSTSKHFTCLLVLLLAEEGKLDIDAPIRTYVPELSGPGGDPTLRQLMQHRGGSRCYLDLAFISHGMCLSSSGAALAAQLRQRGRNFVPGAAMIYNNGGYHLLSIAIDRVSDVPYEVQLSDRLFAPLGMTDTASVPSDYVITPGIATMHVPLPDGRWRRGLFPSEEIRGEGGIVSTIDDMLRWTAHLRARNRFGSAGSWQALVTPAESGDDPANAYALGLRLQSYRGLKAIHHAGGVIGGSSQMMTVPEYGLDIVILSNGAPSANPVRLAEQIVDVVLADRIGPEASTISAKDYEPVVGDWWSPETGMIYGLVEEGGLLKLQICKVPMNLMLERSPNGAAIALSSGLGEIKLDLDAALAGHELVIAFGGKPARYQRIGKNDGEKFPVEAAADQYYSADADTTAMITRNGDGMVIHMTDKCGSVEANFVPAGELVAYAEPSSPTVMFWCALTFERQGDVAIGFRLNTMRTRDLEFRRI